MKLANLSDDYFTNRQDRYHVFSSKEITNYFKDIYDVVCKLSFAIKPSEDEGGFSMDWPTGNTGSSPLDDPNGFRARATKALAPMIRPAAQTRAHSTAADTLVYPLLQFTPLLKPDTSTELPTLTTVLKTLATPKFQRSSWTFTAGYFNMTPEVRGLLLATNPARATVIAASPWANGFYGSKGVSGMLPDAYTVLARKFVKAVAQRGMSSQISLKEWRKGTVNEPGGWTYHAKGLWVTLPNEKEPSISLVGSSNYTKRSYSLDLEANALIVTRNPSLMKRLAEEETWLQEHAKVVDQDEYARNERRVGLRVRISMLIVTLLGGAL
ncbi:hypothetical protein LTS18_013442 [Coniosporium uncinatum]|uniref:Uncharacterized protein n=1 Tax=Coniosporium uncinatum TaxID=93489 RepID=A0ACC3D913_9PEZI|nr:hypothetical protein LTS18_013442 [Coniosporium uncinatum]